VRRIALAVPVLLALADCGAGERVSPLEWQGKPLSVVPPTLPTDHIVMGKVRNTSIRDEFRVDASALRVVDADGRPVQAHAQFIASYAHGLYGAYQKPKREETSELLRLGIKLRLAPGRDAPLYVAYRMRPGLKLPLHVTYPKGTLSLPR
jgi:hypothetical protein